MPGPVSCRSISRPKAAGSSSHERIDRQTPPSSVNFRALEIRLFSTWRRRTGSPSTQAGAAAAPWTRSFRPLAAASRCQKRRVWASRSRRLKVVASTVIRPASSLAWSSRSSSRAFIITPAWPIRAAWARAPVSAADRSSSAAPVRMAPMGVRRSWPTAARKAARLAISRSAATRFCSASMRAAASAARACFRRFQVLTQ